MAELSRSIGVKIRTDAEGDPETIKRTADEIERLGEAAEEAAPKLQKASDATNAFGDTTDLAGNVLPDISASLRDVGKAHEDAAKGAERHIGTVNSLDDLFKSFGGSAGLLVGKLALVWASFREGWQAGEDLRKKLNEVTDGGFDRFIQAAAGYTRGAEALVGANDSAAQSAERLNNMLNVLAKEGMDTTGMSAAAIEIAYEKLGKKMQAESIAFANAQREMAESAEANAERQEAAAAKVADSWQKHLDASAADSARRTEEELAQVAKLQEEQAAAAAAVVEQVTARWAEAFANNPAIAWLENLNAKLQETREKSDAATASVTALVAAADGGSPGFPFKAGTPRYAPEGGFLTPSGGPLGPAGGGGVG
jgi:hypothetical protein